MGEEVDVREHVNFELVRDILDSISGHNLMEVAVTLIFVIGIGVAFKNGSQESEEDMNMTKVLVDPCFYFASECLSRGVVSFQGVKQ